MEFCPPTFATVGFIWPLEAIVLLPAQSWCAMVKFKELRDDSAAFCGDLDQMRMQLQMAEKGCIISATGQEDEAL